MRLIFVFIALATLPIGVLPAAAACATGGQSVFSCSFHGGSKEVQLCLHTDRVTYAFGRPGQRSELQLAAPLDQSEFLPWPGIGPTMFNTMVFFNNRHGYAVTGTLERGTQENQPVAEPGGLIEVSRDGQSLATLRCDAGSVRDGLDAIHDAKRAAGACWDHSRQVWAACRN
ncbi:hypothetical protein [Paracoccus tegillarcae]|uniref:Uncharacterized protein n=1 Tax=Paracoccus tegillarcae TaxID=1529068 RepID=A0A2K9ESU0_9RHOB|nr:hypothetical protein [Paracoccus tegillarcae]AUH32274.1 hypothetical protein CUV01_01660 [Paracoccus tegillarcae]